MTWVSLNMYSFITKLMDAKHISQAPSGLLHMATEPLCLHSTWGEFFFAKSDFPLSGLGVFEVVMLFFWRAQDLFPIYDIISPHILVWFLLSYFSLRVQSLPIYTLNIFLVFPVINFIFTIKLYCFSPHTQKKKG